MRKAISMRYVKATLAAVLLLAPLLGVALAADTDSRFFSREKLQISSSSATATMTAAVWTTTQPILTIAPEAQHALHDVRVCIDLAKATTGFAAGYTSETVILSWSRKVDGSNWRVVSNSQTTALSGTNAASSAIELFIGDVGPTEQVRVNIKLSAEGADIVMPYVVTYTAGARATLTPAS